MNKQKYYTAAVLVVTCFCVMGCASLNKTYPERNYYLFKLPEAENSLQHSSDSIALVKRFTLSPANMSKQFIYRTSELEYESDFYNQFFRIPSALVTEEFVLWLDKSGLFRQVVTPSIQIPYDYFIEGNIVRLYGDFRSTTNPTAVMELQLFLLEPTDTGDNNLVFAKTYESTIGIGAPRADELMNGWNKGLDGIIAEFAADIAGLVNTN